jgi:hypothetical protein
VLEFCDYLPDGLVLDVCAVVNVADDGQSSDLLCKIILSTGCRVEERFAGAFGIICRTKGLVDSVDTGMAMIGIVEPTVEVVGHNSLRSV